MLTMLSTISRCRNIVPALVLIFFCQHRASSAEWNSYGADPGGTRFSSLEQIHRENVGRLELAWSFRTGELGHDAQDGEDLTFQATPILFRGRLYFSTAFGAVFALDAASGERVFRYDAHVPRNQSYSEVTSRGVALWEDPAAEEAANCKSRIVFGTIDARLIAIDADDGELCHGFGNKGIVDLAGPVGMTENGGDYQVTSVPAVVNGVIVVGTSIGDNWSADTGTGVVRGFDARTGIELWSWDPIPRIEGRVGGANAWSTIAADLQRDVVFVPTSSPSPDFFGGLRPGENRWANSVVALRASSGEMLWAYQTVHHDLWDYDVAAEPLLTTLNYEGEARDVVVQATKTGFIFVLDRDTGRPVFPIEETPTPRSDVPGEWTSPTQPFPTALPRLVSHLDVGPDKAWGPNDQHRSACEAMVDGFRWEGLFTPPSHNGAIAFPGNGAGTNWGGGAYDATQNLLILPTNHFATLVRLIPRAEADSQGNDVRRFGESSEIGRQRGAPFAMERRTWRLPGGLPCTPPPWGKLNAIDLSSGTMRWSIPIGVVPETDIAGAPSPAGPILTAGGLVFIGSSDRHLRAYATSTGKELWKVKLPFAPIATPMTYLAPDSRQYVVIAAGGHGKQGLEVGDYVMAFALP